MISQRRNEFPRGQASKKISSISFWKKPHSAENESFSPRPISIHCKTL